MKDKKDINLKWEIKLFIKYFTERSFLYLFQRITKKPHPIHNSRAFALKYHHAK